MCSCSSVGGCSRGSAGETCLPTEQMGSVLVLGQPKAEHTCWQLSPSPALLHALCWGPRWLRKFLCTYCPGKATFRQSSYWAKGFPNRDRFDYKSPVLMPRFPRSVILHAGEARELLKNNVPTHQSFWRHVRKLFLQAGRLKEACEHACVGVHGRTSSAGSMHGHPT